MNPEERIAWILAVLSEANKSLFLDEIIEESKWSSSGGVGFALGALVARGRIGCLADRSFVAERGRVYDNSADLFWGETVMKALQAGPTTLWDIMVRIELFNAAEVGFVLGWLYAKGVVELVCRSGPGYPQWRLIERQE